MGGGDGASLLLQRGCHGVVCSITLLTLCQMSSFITKFDLSQHATSFSVDDLSILITDKQKFVQILRIAEITLSSFQAVCGRRASHLLRKIMEAIRSGKECGDSGMALCAAVVLRELVRTLDTTDERPPFLRQLHPGWIQCVATDY